MPDFDTTGMKLLRTGVWLDPSNGVVHASIADVCQDRGLELTRETEAMISRELQEWFQKQYPGRPVIQGTASGIKKIDPQSPAPVRMIRCKCIAGHDLAGVAYGKICGLDHAFEFLIDILAKAEMTCCRTCGSQDLHLEDAPSDFASVEEAMEQFKTMMQPAN